MSLLSAITPVDLGAAPAPTTAPPGKDAGDIAKVAHEFEAFFIAQIMKNMQPTPGGLTGGGFDQGVYQSMLNDKLSAEMSQQSPLGLAPMLMKALDKMLTPAAPSTTGDAGASAGWAQRFHGYAALTSGYGMRAHPIKGDNEFHHGWDVAAPEGTAVTAQAAGTVTFSGERGGYGNMVELTHQDGSVTLYGHLRARSVEAGASVAAGATLGAVGQTGTATGPHLHFEARANGRSLDPSQWFRTLGKR